MSRRGHRQRRDAAAIKQLPWRRLRNRLRPIEVLSEDEVQAIIEAALMLLETHGFRFLDDRSRDLLRASGAEFDNERNMLRFDRELLREHISHIPGSFGLRARNPDHDLVMGEDHIVFCGVGGPAFVSDLDRGRRPGTYTELCDFMKVLQGLNVIHQEGGGSFEPMDLPPESRHLDLYLAQLTLLDKNGQAYALGGERTADCIAMNRIALGLDDAALAEKPAVLGIVNTNSPMQLDVPMAEAVRVLAEAGQVTCITPFTLAGSMSPATLAGTLTQQTAEVLAVAVLAQIIRPGAPVMYGSFASNVDMQSGAPALGTPEYTKMALASGQLARALGMPLRSSSTTTSNSVDAQAAFESQASLWGAVMGHANLVNHAAGWLEGGLTASFEKLVVDAEMLQMMRETLEPIAISDEEIALDAIREVPPGGHHFGTAHTLARYENAFYAPLVANRQNYEAWEEAGSVNTATRANGIWKKLLADYQKPPIDAATEEALVSYVEKRKREITNNSSREK